jgi:hypothetical protein
MSKFILFPGDTPTSESHFDRQSSSRNSYNSDSTHISHLISQRQLSDSRCPTKCFILFENASSVNANKIHFLEYYGTRARHHHSQKLYVPQVVNDTTSPDDTKEDFANCIKQVLHSISPDELSSYVVSVRTGVAYFFSKRFRFNNYNNYSIKEIHDIIQKKIPTSDNRYYYPPRINNNSNQSDDSLRSSFCNVKPISLSREFVEQLQGYQFHVKNQKHVFRIYLQSDDKQTHVCTVDPASNYSIVEFSKDFQRTSNIGMKIFSMRNNFMIFLDFIRDRHSSKFRETKTYDDIFDFRIQFQYNSLTRSDRMNTIEYELHRQFPSIDPNFINENILQPLNNNHIHDDQEFSISKQLCPYIQFIRRDFGDVYHYTGNDELFENFTIYLESSVEYLIDYDQSTCKRELATHGLVYARLDLNTMTSSNTINEDLLIEKLWNVSGGLTYIAGQCTTSETQQSTNYYTRDGNNYTAEDEILVQRILKQSTLFPMLGLSNNPTNDEIQQSFNRIKNQLDPKWHYIRSGERAREKLYAFYDQYLNDNN